MKKITRATLKSFISKHKNNLWCKPLSGFDGMTDCIMPINSDFAQVNSFDFNQTYSFNISQLWLVGDGRDYFTEYEDESFIGIKISNCCGSSIIAMKK